jgi:hypothetical protein
MADIEVGYASGDLYLYAHVAVNPDQLGFDDNRINAEIHQQLAGLQAQAELAMKDVWNKNKAKAAVGGAHGPST